jgi:hypothetical protein
MSQRSEEGMCPYLGRSLSCKIRKSAEAIVVEGNEPMEGLEDSRINEGLNVKIVRNMIERFMIKIC